MFTQSPVGRLVQRCTDPIEKYRHHGDTIDTPDGPLTYIDNGADTLAVVHLDWVLWAKPHYNTAKHHMTCPQLDDRLGLWCLLDLLPELGVKSDILLTDSEEIGKSTARYFKSPKPYNWMYQFDRHGTDTVLYEYDSEDNRDRLEEHGLLCGEGSFSDICMLSHLGCSGWNVGTGYHHEHSLRCYADLKDTETNARLFAEFWKEHHTTHIPIPEYTPRAYRFDFLWNEPTHDDIWECVCGNENDIARDDCQECGRSFIESNYTWDIGKPYKW